MAWFSGKVSLGGFPDLAGAVNKFSESVKNIEKNFDSALGFEEKPESSTTEASGLWPSSTDRKALFDPVMAFMGHKNEESDTESEEKPESLLQPPKAEEKGQVETESLPQSGAEQTTAKEEKEACKTEEDEDVKHPQTAERVDAVISDHGKAESESPTVPTEARESTIKNVESSDSIDNLQQKEILDVSPSEDKESVEAKSEPGEVDRVETVPPHESHNVVDTRESRGQEKKEESKDEEKIQAEEIVEKIQAEILSIIQAEVNTEPAESDSVSAEVNEGAREIILSGALPPNEPSETVSASASPENNAKVKAVEVDQQANDSATANKEQRLSSEANVSDSPHSVHELEKLKIEMKMMETALQGAARQAQVLNDATILFKYKLALQLLDRRRTSCTWRLGVIIGMLGTVALICVFVLSYRIKPSHCLIELAQLTGAKADEIAKMMNENEHLKAVIEDLKRKSSDAEIETLREEYHQRVSTLERKVYALTKERDTLRREQNKKSDAAALLKEKDEIINQVMAEGEELSKKQAAQEATMRKLRAQIRELEEEKKGLSTKLQVEENKVESIKRDKAATEKLLQETIENHQVELAAQKDYYTNALTAAKEAEALAEARANNEARTEIESRLREAEERQAMLVQALEELRQTLSRKEQQAVFKEDMLRRDIEDLQKRYQASERRCEELITQVPESTRPLLRQIEAIQETTSRRAEAWAAVERSLNSRLQEAEAKAAAAEERERSVNERLSQTLSRINVLEAQISCLRAEQTQLSRSLEKERQRAAESRQEYLAAKEDADTQEGRANQLEEEIRELRRKHKQELQEALMHRELLQQVLLLDLEREKAARLDLEKTAYVHSSAVSDQTPITKHNSGLENGSLSRKLSSASSLGSMEESHFLQASLDSSDNLSERRNFAEATVSPYYMKSMTSSAFEATLRQKEGELASYMSRLASLESIRDSLAEELVKMTAQCEKLQAEAATLPGIRAELDALRRRHSAALELMGERDEELEELRADIVDLKEMYREQVNMLVNKVFPSFPSDAGFAKGLAVSIKSLAAEYYYIVDSGGKLNQVGMRGRHVDAYSTYKRVSSRDYYLGSDHDKDKDKDDKDDTSIRMPNGLGKDVGNPSWKRSLPHILVATISSFLFGYHLGVVNETLESMSLDLGFSGNTMAEGGAFIGSMFSGWITDEIGRRRAFQLCALPMIVGASMSAITKNLWGMLLGRFFVGTGMGIGPPVAALYVAEVSPAYVRGAYGSCTQIATCFGILAALFIGLPAKEVVGWWRMCFWVSAVPAVILAFLMEFCAESPHWLFKVISSLAYQSRAPSALVQWGLRIIMKFITNSCHSLDYAVRGRGAEAEAEFEKLLGGVHVKYSMAELSKSDRGDEADTVKFSELFYGRHSRVVFIGSGLFALQQLSGINAVFYFSSTVFKNAGVPSDSANICVGIANLSGSIIAMLLMDKLGRKVLLLGSFSGMAVAMGVQATAATSFVSSSGSLYLSLGGMLLSQNSVNIYVEWCKPVLDDIIVKRVVVTFSLGAGPVPGLLLSEIFPNRIRAKAMAFCMAVHWVINFFVGLLFLRLLEQLGPLVLYTIFGAFCFLAVIFVKRNVMETKGKSLQEIEIALLPQE
ncbi:hypothetical protein JRO89_XS09G0172200 [Xanthoceras sorbifolium]|uniref:Major facilitator superfamily (MFS) profile domain-containing protein n=1 Tax=Xanthoceras sorbifolium TaxID=99658 RepID=A0ABQ8HLL5_9ROSI|nr:hypothetical protein JRO89_XS09G0172200 [Xanthoceras sorbifolium]